ncbi:MAG: DUF6194 family protein [Candidatus Dormibacteraceae bacterium]
MTEDDVIQFVAGLPGVVPITASEANGGPEDSWGNSFFFYDPNNSLPTNQRFPFTTIVTKDYEGFDTSSNLNRPGIFRLNMAVGRQRFEELFGYSPAEHAGHAQSFDYAALYQIIPHPMYAVQGWVSIVCPSIRTSQEAGSLITYAHSRATERYRPRA